MKTMRWLLLTLLIIPAIELGVFIWIGDIIGPWWIVTLIILSGLLGISLAKKQGRAVWIKAQQSMNNRQAPTKEIVDGICILFGGVLLFLPGFITDIIGLFLIIPWTRRPFKSIIQKWIMWKVSKSTIIYRK
jgi:UPF0716 protein FxsA